MKIKFIAAILTGTMLVAFTTCAQIINGSFENDFAAWDTTPGCYIIGHPGIQPIGTHGETCADLGGGDISGAVLSQTFPCEPNTPYVLTFRSVCNAGQDLEAVTAWRVAISDESTLLAEQSFTQKNVGQPAGNFGFVTRKVPFRTGANTTSATIRFIDTTPNGGIAVDTGLDQISVTPNRRRANVIVNSSFERAFDGWNANNGCFIIGHDPAEPIGTDGFFSADLGGGDITGAVLSQTFNCPQSGLYRLRYNSVCNAGNDLSNVTMWDVVVTADGQEIARRHLSQQNAGWPHGKFGFRHRTMTFKVPSGVQDVTVSFVDTTPGGGVGIDTAFDQVRVNAIRSIPVHRLGDPDSRTQENVRIQRN